MTGHSFSIRIQEKFSVLILSVYLSGKISMENTIDDIVSKLSQHCESIPGLLRMTLMNSLAILLKKASLDLKLNKVSDEINKNSSQY